MGTHYRCGSKRRRLEVGRSTTINGIDYLEVAECQKTLQVHFFHKLPEGPNALTEDNVIIEGGVRVTDVRVKEATSSGKVLTVVVDKPGDYSAYRLRLVRSSVETVPPEGLDLRLSEIEFSFKVDCPSEFDCLADDVCPEPAWPAPRIDYLARDYASFRRLMLDRLATVMPDWEERNPADLGVALVELLAYAADHQSYYQDAVATEAYLGTARRRVSVRRHARLLDYPVHDGCNARAWVTVHFVPEKPEHDGARLPCPSGDRPGTPLLTVVEGTSGALDPQDALVAVNAGAETFETMHDLTLRGAHNEIGLYTWGDEECCLPTGATRATLLDHPKASPERLSLGEGDVLVFEEVKGLESGNPADADPGHRHAVRLTKVVSESGANAPLTDPLYGQEITEVEWHPEDALPFPLCISTRELAGVSVARGNVVLVDHGRTIAGEPLGEVPEDGRFRPALGSGPLTHQGRVRDRENRLLAFDPGAPAAAALRWETRDVRPEVRLLERDDGEQPWLPQRDLLNSDRFADEFVVETEDDGLARLRFGDGVKGRRPVEGLEATYRIGNGRAGNVGAGAISNVVVDPERFADPTTAAHLKASIKEVRNPLPARGGTDPERTEQVRLYAPQAFRTQERAVTAADYAAAAERHHEVHKAAATRRWSGSWYTWYVTVDRKRGLPVDADFEEELRRFLERFRLACYDLEIEGPIFVSLDVALTVCVEPGYLRSNVKETLLGETFGRVDLPGGGRGFFHPDNFTFGQPVYLSRVVAAAMEVPGVSWVEPVRFQRRGQVSRGELEDGRIVFARLEIAKLDNDANAPENGSIKLDMQGGP